MKKTKMKSLTSLIVIVLTTSDCAHIVKSQKEAEVISYATGGFREIDPSNPPKHGVWSTWDDARTIANNNRIEREQFRNEIASFTRMNYELTEKLKEEEEKNRLLNTGYKSFLAHWGLPIGLLGGFAIGMGVAIGLGDKK